MNEAWLRLRWSISYWISRAGVLCSGFLPTRLWYRLFDPFADLAFLLARRHRRNLIENLSRVIGAEEAPAAARRVFHNFARYVVDLYQLPSLGREALQRRIDFNDWARLDQALSEGKGTVFATLHLGQAELGAAAVSAYGRPISAIAENLPTPAMNELIQGLRSALGIKVIKAKGARSELLRCLSRGEVLALMFDAESPKGGVLVEFFGAPASFSDAPARVALRSGARVLPAVVSRDPNDPSRLIPSIDFDLTFEPTGDEEADVQALTQAIATSFEVFVQRFADQWFAFKPQWPALKPAKNEQAWKLWALVLATRLGGFLPHSASYLMAGLAGDLAFRFRVPTRLDVEDNMRHVYGPSASESQIKAAARECFRNVARYYVDLVRLPKMTREELLETRVRRHGFDKLKSRLDAGQGVIVATAHFGNPEIAVQVGALLGLDVLVLAEPLEPPAFAQIMKDIRSHNGPRYEDVGYQTMAMALRHLRAGGCLAIACDRDIQGKGVPVPFFGEPIRVPLGAAELAARTGAVIMPAYCQRDGDDFDLYFEEPMETVQSSDPKTDALINTRNLLARMEPWLRADPGQWMVLERIWKPIATQNEGIEPLPALSSEKITDAASNG